MNGYKTQIVSILQIVSSIALLFGVNIEPGVIDELSVLLAQAVGGTLGATGIIHLILRQLTTGPAGPGVITTILNSVLSILKVK